MSRLLRWGLAGVVLVVAGAWLAVGLLPRVDDAGMWRYDAEALTEEDDFDESIESTVLDPSDGTYDGLWTFENRGLAPITVRLAEPDSSPYLFWEASLIKLDQATYEPLGEADTVHVARNEVFGVEFSHGLGCVSSASGNSVGISDTRLTVTTLGLPRDVNVPFPVTVHVGFSTDFEPPEDCMDEGRPQQPGFPVGW